jgi:hypothetical protein
MTDDSTDSASSAGHRERMRSRLLAGDEAALSEEAILELLLTYSIPRRDVRPLAEALLVRFGSLAKVLESGPGDLAKVSGIKENSIALLKLVAHLTGGGGSLETPTQEAPTSDDLPPQPPGGDDESSGSAPEDRVVPPSKSAKSPGPPKLQVSNGYSLDAAQNARLLTYINEHPEVRRFARRDVMEGTGLSEGQVESLASIGAAIGLVAPRTQVLTPFGKLVTKHDLFLDSIITLEFCHFLGAGNPRNLIWFMIFNDLLANEKPTDQAGWSAWVREKLAGQYSEGSMVKHVAHEVRFLLDAYTVKNFNKLNLLIETPDKTLALRRYTALQPLSLAAMIYLVGERHQARLVPFTDLHAEPGSPGRVFGLDPSSLRQMVELLHQRGWVRFEVRHGLDQVRLVDGFEPLEFLAAAYEQRSPETSPSPDSEPERLLL